MSNTDSESPAKIFTSFSAIAVIVGIVVGIGIFRLPSIVAQNTTSELHYLGFWIAGGLISIIGALCYAELATKKPDAGGEYYFLTEAYGSTVGFLFSWGRMTVIQTGSIALAAFILGDYASTIYDLGPYSSSLYAGLTVIGLTGLNIWGTHPSKNAQNGMTTLIVSILAICGIVGFFTGGEITSQEYTNNLTNSSAGAAMIFVLLTYGGWNEGVYLSAELKNVRQNMSRVLIIGLSVITILYILINSAYLQVLGLEQLRASETIGVDLTNKIFGTEGAFLMAVIVIISALSTANATIITGARTNYALGRDFKALKWIGKWNSNYNSPINALLVQGSISLGLIFLGAFTKEAVSTMVDYTAPVFWFFILLTTISLFIFRRQDNSSGDNFEVPLYPLTPLLFIIACLYLLYSSVMFTGWGAVIGIIFLLIGLPVYYWAQNKSNIASNS